MSHKEVNYNKSVFLGNGRLRDGFHYSSKNTIEHELVKAGVCFYIQRKGLEYFTEHPWYGDRKIGIPDIYIPEHNMYIEILHSETLQMLSAKCKKYPKVPSQYYISTEDVMTDRCLDFKKLEEKVKEILP